MYRPAVNFQPGEGHSWPSDTPLALSCLSSSRSSPGTAIGEGGEREEKEEEREEEEVIWYYWHYPSSFCQLSKQNLLIPCYESTSF